jgi:hypothetical protein
MDTTGFRLERATSGHPTLQVWASAWQGLRRRKAMWPWMLLALGLAALLPAEVLLPPGTATKAMRTLMMVLLSSVALGVWLLFVFNLLQQNQPQWARLVPGHVAALRRALYLGAAAIAACAAALASLAGGSGPVAALIAGPLCAAVACGLRWPLLWALLIVLPITAPWALHSMPLALLARAWAEAPWALAGAVLAGTALALRGVVFSGDAAHARAQLWLTAAASQMRGDTSGLVHRQFSAGWFGPTRWGDWLYTTWLLRLLARPDSSLRGRLALGLGPQGHWSGSFATALYLVAVLVIVSTLGWLAQIQFVQATQGGLLIALALAGLQVPLQLPAALWASRREQALLALLPGAPSGTTLNRWLAVRLAALDVSVMLGLMVIVAAFSQVWPPNPSFARVDDVVLGAFVVGLLVTPLLWRDWARARAPSGLLQWGVIGASFGVGVIAWIWVDSYERPWYELIPWTASVALPLALWRWHRLQRLPAAWPVGRIVG